MHSLNAFHKISIKIEVLACFSSLMIIINVVAVVSLAAVNCYYLRYGYDNGR